MSGHINPLAMRNLLKRWPGLLPGIAIGIIVGVVLSIQPDGNHRRLQQHEGGHQHENGKAGHHGESHHQLIASPLLFVQHLRGLGAYHKLEAERMYLRLLAGLLSGAFTNCDHGADYPRLLTCLHDIYRLGRTGFNGVWPKPVFVSMAGLARLHSLARIIGNLQKVSGSLLEAGVWRGGMSILATAALQVYGMGARHVYLADSFSGLPKPRVDSLRPDEVKYSTGYLQYKLNVGGKERVEAAFDVFGISRENVSLVPGYFVESLPPLREQMIGRGERLSVLRLDGDMYDSTVDILYNMYDLLVVGGYLIVDDFGWCTAPHPAARSTPTAAPLHTFRLHSSR